MASTSNANSKDQQHPQEKTDRAIANQLLSGEPTDYNLAELARLKIRYRGFPGARTIQADLEKVLQKWQLTEEKLYEKTRQLHAREQIYESRSRKKGKEDWS